MILLLLLAIVQGGFYEGAFDSTYFADANLNVTATNSVFDNCTGVVAIGENGTFSRFNGTIFAERANITITESNATIHCSNSTIIALKNRLNITLKNCTLKASLNEILELKVLDDWNEFSRMEYLPLIYSYKEKRFWTFAGNHWPNQELDITDKNGDGLADYAVCPKVYMSKYQSTEFSLLCEPVLVEGIENYEWHGIELPPLSEFRMNEEGTLEYVGPVKVESPTETEKTPEKITAEYIFVSLAILIVSLTSGALLVLYITGKPISAKNRRNV